MKLKTVAVTLGVSMIVSTAGINLTFAASTGDDLQKKINKVHNEQKQKQREAEEKKDKLEQVQKKRAQTIGEAEQLESEIAKTTKQISQIQSDVAEIKKSIDQLQTKIKETKKRIQRRNEILKDRVRVMYQNGGSVNYLQVLLGSQSFSNFLDRVLALNLIAEQDKKLLEEQKADKRTLEKDKKKVQQELAKLEGQLNELEDLNAELKQKKQKKNALIEQLKEKASEIEDDLMDIQESQNLLEAQEAAFKEELERQESSSSMGGNKTNVGAGSASGTFAWPARGVVTSNFGYRSYDNDVHTGLDIAANGTVPIRAVAPGTVIRSYLSSSYGNVVFIAHVINGQQYTTVYAHMRSRSVSTGQKVQQGQRVGYMGNTGNSSGQHLHFELHKGQWNINKSNAVPALNYLP